MILQEKVIVKIQSGQSISYFEKLGYIIPKHNPRYFTKNNMQKVKKGTTIIVKVSDLPKGSHIKVLCKCDKCGKERLLAFRRYRPFCHKCKASLLTGENSARYNVNLSEKERKQQHNIIGINNWRNKVKKRNNHTCQKCGSKKHLHAHHINDFKHFPEERLKIENGITLCFECHNAKNGKSIHNIYGKYPNKKQINEFLNKSFIFLS